MSNVEQLIRVNLFGGVICTGIICLSLFWIVVEIRGCATDYNVHQAEKVNMYNQGWHAGRDFEEKMMEVED